MRQEVATEIRITWSNRETLITDYWITSTTDGRAMLDTIRRRYRSMQLQAEYLEYAVRDELEAMLQNKYKTPDLWFDLLIASLNRVNWLEIVKYHQ